MRLYLDLCVFNRPFDYQGNAKIALETSVFIYILEMIEQGVYTLVTSEALIYENSRNPYENRKAQIESYFDLAKEIIKINDIDIERAKFLTKLGFSGIDALHIALAEKGKVDYFITCDMGIVKLYKKHQGKIKVRVLSLIEFINLEVK